MLEKQKNEQGNANGKRDEESDNSVGGNHPFLYMLGNLMKKIDTKHTQKENSETVLYYGNKEDEKRKIGQISYGKRSDDNISKDRIREFKRKSEVMKQYPKPIETGYEQPIEEDNLNLCKKTGMKLKQNQINRVIETKTSFEHQPKELIKTINPSQKGEYVFLNL